MRHASLCDSRKLSMDIFIRHCVVGEKKDRLYLLNNTENGFQKLVRELDHFEKNLDINNATSISKFRDHLELLRALNTSGHEKVFALSTIRDMKSGVECCLAEALAALYKVGNGSVICCPLIDPTSFFYFGEDVSTQLMWVIGSGSRIAK
jgi:hypothetical protein